MSKPESQGSPSPTNYELAAGLKSITTHGKPGLQPSAPTLSEIPSQTLLATDNPLDPKWQARMTYVLKKCVAQATAPQMMIILSQLLAQDVTTFKSKERCNFMEIVCRTIAHLNDCLENLSFSTDKTLKEKIHYAASTRTTLEKLQQKIEYFSDTHPTPTQKHARINVYLAIAVTHKIEGELFLAEFISDNGKEALSSEQFNEIKEKVFSANDFLQQSLAIWEEAGTKRPPGKEEDDDFRNVEKMKIYYELCRNELLRYKITPTNLAKLREYTLAELQALHQLLETFEGKEKQEFISKSAACLRDTFETCKEKNAAWLKKLFQEIQTQVELPNLPGDVLQTIKCGLTELATTKSTMSTAAKRKARRKKAKKLEAAAAEAAAEKEQNPTFKGPRWADEGAPGEDNFPDEEPLDGSLAVQEEPHKQPGSPVAKKLPAITSHEQTTLPPSYASFFQQPSSKRKSPQPKEERKSPQPKKERESPQPKEEGWTTVTRKRQGRKPF